MTARPLLALAAAILGASSLAASGLAASAAWGQASPAAGAPAAAQASSPVKQGERLPGYLDAAGVPDSVAILPPPPLPGSPIGQLDQEIYRQTRALAGTPRWRLATADAVETPQAMLDDFACAMGVKLDQTTAPALLHLLTRVGRDAGAITSRAKDHYRRPRPFVDNDAPICVARTADLAASPSYPSGHTTASWAVGLILAEIEPERATPILARARAYGESRVVCGVHWYSDVEEGRTNGAALVAALQANPTFRADLTAASVQVGVARAAGAPVPGPAECRDADAAAAHTPWAP